MSAKKIIENYKVLLVLALIVIAGVFFFVFRLHQGDVKALTEFVASYEKFDKAVSSYSLGGTDDLKSKANAALVELNASSAVRISSLVQHDAELMSTELEIADFSAKELAGLSAYKSSDKRKTAYARFQELAGLKE